MKTLAYVLTSTLLFACTAGDGSLPESGDPGDPGATGPEVARPPGGPVRGETIHPDDPGDDVVEACRADAEFDFQVLGSGLSAWEGRRVVASGIENDLLVEPTASKRVVWLAGKIVDGKFALYCPRPLSENYGYPSYALFVDVDGDGACNPGDAGYQMQLYGWNASVTDEIAATSWATIPAPGTPGYMGPPIGSTAGDFCAGYFASP